MRFRAISIGAALLACVSLAAQEAAASKVYEGSDSFERKGVEYRLTWKASKVTTGLYAGESTKVSYSVYGDGEFLHPRTLNGGSIIGCRHIPPERVGWAALGKPQVGWLLKLSGNCREFSSLKILIVVPYKEKYTALSDYLATEFIANKPPIILNAKNGNILIWSSYVQWSAAGIGNAFFVPKVRSISLDSWGRLHVSCPPLPKNVRLWPQELPSRDFLGDFYAGLDRLDAGVMKSALDAYRKIDYQALHYHGLPEDRAGLERLTREIKLIGDRIGSAKSSLPVLWLSWGKQRGRCR